MGFGTRRGPGGQQSGVIVEGTAWAVALVAWTLLCAAPGAYGATCDEAGADELRTALETIERAVDPCGETGDVRRVVAEFRRSAGTRVCVSRESERSFIVPGEGEERIRTTITWNPTLRTELERGCDGDPERAVLRDPIASLLHELVHAVQACNGLEPAEHELEAVRVENIYRRAHDLCQRTGYGDVQLPPTMAVSCEPSRCRCRGTPPAPTREASLPVPAAPAETAAGDTAEHP